MSQLVRDSVMISDDELSQTSANVSQKRATRSERDLTNTHLGQLLFAGSDSDSTPLRAKHTEKLSKIDHETGSHSQKSHDRTSSNVKRSQNSSTPTGSKQKKRKASPRLERNGKSQFRKSYAEVPIDDTDDYMSESASGPARPISKKLPTKKAEKEVFRTDYDSDWENRHWEICEVCREDDGKLVYCQGCAVGVHQRCLGGPHDRKHHVTKVDERDFVLQCRHCVGKGGQKGGNRSYITGKVGPLCKPLEAIPSSHAEGKNDRSGTSEEPLVNLYPDKSSLEATRTKLKERLYKPESVMFRCVSCLRPAMFEDLVDPANDPTYDPAQCADCNSHKNMVVGLVLGWRNLIDDKLDTMEVQKKELPKDFLREYLVKWEGAPYTKVEWITASWLHGIATVKKKNFDAKNLAAIEMEESVIPEDYNRVDIVLDVVYKGKRSFEDMNFENEKSALAAVTRVRRFLAKWQQVQYDDITWDEPPRANSSDDLIQGRRKAFVAAYQDWVRGFYVMVDKKHATRAVKISDAPFTLLEKKKQPTELIGGELMPYQLEGLNWLYYQYYLKHPAILADEMGLGKTIQIISFLSVLFTDWAIAPFLIVAPNSTISNWKREFQKWAPDMRVAAYYGEKTAKAAIEKYEIIHKDTAGQPLKVHALITSYNTIESDAALLKRYDWACLVVDEGQRLKNDESILFKSLSSFRVNHRVLLTGTPLQNNTKELFNLLQFLDPKKMNASQLEAHFDIEKQESLTELHTMLQPYFLRRTKVQVLKFLPPKNEVIVPVTMTSLQRELYKTILSKNAELMRLVMSRAAAGKPIQNYNNSSLGNVLQQIRKILSHPFIYSPDIEEGDVDEHQAVINLTNACAKLLLLKVLLPALKAQGHRVLIFCQFLMMLDILEDWMDATGISHCRIDGSTPTPIRQEAIDRFNAPGSDISCFLLSTRAGGVGINLATADTVIIYDADFNPHQDLQAVARAHRIGQKHKVVVFTLVTRNTAEEKILQIGRQKMVLDQLIIENMATKEENVPYQEILSFGAAALFDSEAKNELVYDEPTVNSLIESSFAGAVSDEVGDKEGSKDSFGFAKVWAVDGLKDGDLGQDEAAQKVSDDLWAKILAHRALEAKAEADKKSAEFSKGRRRTVKDYSEANAGKLLISAIRAADGEDGVEDMDIVPVANEEDDKSVVLSDPRMTDSSGYSDLSSDAGLVDDTADQFEGILGENGTSTLVDQLNQEGNQKLQMRDKNAVAKPAKQCLICNEVHLGGQCQLRNIPLEVCTLCKTVHTSGSRRCPVFNDVASMRAIVEDLKKSSEPPELVDQARAYLKNLIGTITRAEKRAHKQKTTLLTSNTAPAPDVNLASATAEA